jgi:hypothetical protein
MEDTMRFTLVITFLLAAAFVLACSPQQKVQTLQQNIIIPHTEAPQEVSFDLNFDKDHIEPIVMSVHKNDIVHFNFLMKTPLYLSLDGYFNDYVDTGRFSFQATQTGEFTLECPTCKKPILGYLIVQ